MVLCVFSLRDLLFVASLSFDRRVFDGVACCYLFSFFAFLDPGDYLDKFSFRRVFLFSLFLNQLCSAVSAICLTRTRPRLFLFFLHLFRGSPFSPAERNVVIQFHQPVVRLIACKLDKREKVVVYHRLQHLPCVIYKT